MRRRYRVWAGSPKGSPEDPKRCIAAVADGGRSCLFHQCSNKRGKGPEGNYCGLHAKQLAAGKHVYVPDDEGD